MKLVMTLLVRNEADIVKANIDYHLAQGVDFVIVTDHGSEDGTSEILQDYERMGVVHVIRDEGEGHHQSERVTRMSELARIRHNADWVINNDADEFWWPLVGDLRDVFASIPARFSQIEVQRRNFRPRPGSDEDEPFYSQLVYREGSSSNLNGEPLERKVAHRPWSGVVVAPGNHSVRGRDLPAIPSGELLEIFHFPMRSYEQFERKVLQTGQGYEQVHDRSPMVGCDQLALLELHRSGKLREYYESRLLEDEALERGLQMGTLVLDRRLANFMNGSGLRATGTRPDAPFARALLGRLMGALTEVEDQREQLTQMQIESEQATEGLSRLSGQVEDLTGRLRETERKLQTTRDQLQSTSHALHLLRTSRLMRLTNWPRRLYYRTIQRTQAKDPFIP